MNKMINTPINPFQSSLIINSTNIPSAHPIPINYIRRFSPKFQSASLLNNKYPTEEFSVNQITE